MVLCLSPTGLSVGRALYESGVPVYGADTDILEIGHYSSFFRHHSPFFLERKLDRLLDTLIAFAKSCNHSPVLFPAGDDQIEWVAHHHADLKPYFRLQDCAKPETASRFVDKRIFYEWVRTAYDHLPKTCVPENEEQVQAVAEDLQYPVILKPARGHAWRRHLRGAKVLEVSTPSELLREYRRHALFDSALVLQEVIPGPENEIVVAACAIGQKGEPLSVFTARKARQYPYYFGSASYCVSEWVPEVAELSIDILTRLRFRGVCGTEFKRDHRTGRWALIEINPRPTLWFDVARASGVNPVDAIYRDLAGLPQNPRRHQRDGITWRYLARDLIACYRYWWRSDPQTPSMISTLKWPHSEAIASKQDISAAFVYPFYVIIHALRHLIT